MGSRSSSNAWRARFVAGCTILGILGAAGCATVRPEDRETLADPAMTFGSEGEVGTHEAHVFENREGSFGGGSVSGGGCGCN